MRRLGEDVRPRHEECGREPVRFRLGLRALRYLFLAVRDEVSEFVGGVEAPVFRCLLGAQQNEWDPGEVSCPWGWRPSRSWTIRQAAVMSLPSGGRYPAVWLELPLVGPPGLRMALGSRQHGRTAWTKVRRSA